MSASSFPSTFMAANNDKTHFEQEEMWQGSINDMFPETLQLCELFCFDGSLDLSYNCTQPKRATCVKEGNSWCQLPVFSWILCVDQLSSDPQDCLIQTKEFLLGPRESMNKRVVCQELGFWDQPLWYLLPHVLQKADKDFVHLTLLQNVSTCSDIVWRYVCGRSQLPHQSMFLFTKRPQKTVQVYCVEAFMSKQTSAADTQNEIQPHKGWQATTFSYDACLAHLSRLEFNMKANNSATTKK